MNEGLLAGLEGIACRFVIPVFALTAGAKEIRSLGDARLPRLLCPADCDT
jgi:hypothetical protein